MRMSRFSLRPRLRPQPNNEGGEALIQVGGRSYELLYEHKNAWNAEAFRNRYSDVLERYDYIIGDWGYNQLRLKGFFKDGHPKAGKDSSYSSIVDYINEYCNFGCAYFMLQKLPSPKKQPGDGAGGDHSRDELQDEAHETQLGDEDGVAESLPARQDHAREARGAAEPNESLQADDAAASEAGKESPQLEHSIAERVLTKEMPERAEQHDTDSSDAAQASPGQDQSDGKEEAHDVAAAVHAGGTEREEAQSVAIKGIDRELNQSGRPGRNLRDPSHGGADRKPDQASAADKAEPVNDHTAQHGGHKDAGREQGQRNRSRMRDTAADSVSGGGRSSSYGARGRDGGQPSAKQADKHAASQHKSLNKEARGVEGRERGKSAPHTAAREVSGEPSAGATARQTAHEAGAVKPSGREPSARESGRREATQDRGQHRVSQPGKNTSSDKDSTASARGFGRDKQRPAGFSKGKDRGQARDVQRDRGDSEGRPKPKDMKQQPSTSREAVKTGDTPQ